MLRSFFPWADARGWIRRHLVPVLLAIAIALGLSTVSDVYAAVNDPVTYTSTGWRNNAGGTGCTGYTCTAQDACESYRSYAKPTYHLTQILINAANGLSAACWLADAGVSGVGSAVSSISRQDAYVPGPPAPTCPAKGQTSSANYYTVVSDSQLGYSLDFCIPMTGTSGGCGMTASGRAGGLNKTTGKWEYQFMGPLTTTGQVCTGNGTGVTNPKTDTEAPQKCDKTAGMCTGTVNGVEVCVKCAQTDSANTSTTKTSNADGSTTQTTTNVSTTVNGDSVTTNTTTTTVNTPAGGGTPTTSTKSDSTTESKDLYCSKNPTSTACKDQGNSVSGGDTCDAPPVCNGDAIQCAMVQQQYKTRCDMQKTDATVTLGQQLATGSDPMASQLPTPEKATQIDLSDRLANVDDMGIAAQCIPDLHIALPALPGTQGGTSLNISTGPLCDFGKLFGLLNLLGTTVLCAYMLRGSF